MHGKRASIVSRRRKKYSGYKHQMGGTDMMDGPKKEKILRKQKKKIDRREGKKIDWE